MWIIKDEQGNVLVSMPRIFKTAKVITIETSVIKNKEVYVWYRFVYHRGDGVLMEVKKAHEEWQRNGSDYPAHTNDVCSKLIRLFRRSARKLNPKVKFFIKVLKW